MFLSLFKTSDIGVHLNNPHPTLRPSSLTGQSQFLPRGKQPLPTILILGVGDLDLSSLYIYLKDKYIGPQGHLGKFWATWRMRWGTWLRFLRTNLSFYSLQNFMSFSDYAHFPVCVLVSEWTQYTFERCRMQTCGGWIFSKMVWSLQKDLSPCSCKYHQSLFQF